MRALQLFVKIWSWQNVSETKDDTDYVRGQGKVGQSCHILDKLPILQGKVNTTMGGWDQLPEPLLVAIFNQLTAAQVL